MADVSLDIPRRLNDPPRMFWWDLDLSLLVIAAAYGRAKSGKHPAYALHLVYWYLPAPVTGLKRTPPSYLREMVG